MSCDYVKILTRNGTNGRELVRQMEIVLDPHKLYLCDFDDPHYTRFVILNSKSHHREFVKKIFEQLNNSSWHPEIAPNENNGNLVVYLVCGPAIPNHEYLFSLNTHIQTTNYGNSVQEDELAKQFKGINIQ